MTKSVKLVWRRESNEKLANIILIPADQDPEFIEPELIVAVIAPEMSASNRWEVTGRTITLRGRKLGRVCFIREAKDVVARELAKEVVS